MSKARPGGPTRRWWLAALAVVLLIGLLAALIYGGQIKSLWLASTHGTTEQQASAWIDAATVPGEVAGVTVTPYVDEDEAWDLISVSFVDSESVSSDTVLGILESLADATDPDQASDWQGVLFTDAYGAAIREDMSPYVSLDRLDYGLVILTPTDFDLAAYEPDPADADLLAFEDSFALLSAADSFTATRWDASQDATGVLTVSLDPRSDADDAATDLLLRTVVAATASYAVEHDLDEAQIVVVELPTDVEFASLAVVADLEAFGGLVDIGDVDAHVTLETAEVLEAAASVVD